jgi:pyridoxine 4-dehydrogenase
MYLSADQNVCKAVTWRQRMNTTFTLGGEFEVNRLGLGAMRIVDDPVEGVRVLRRAVELGVNFIDTADIYGAGRSEELVAAGLYPYPDDLVITTKGGLGYGLQDRIRDGRPEHLRSACEASLRRLRLERIDLYQFHRHDPEVPIEESVGALEQLRVEGKIHFIGVSNVSLEQLRRAQSVARIASVQNEFNRGLLTSDDVLNVCEAEGLAFIPWAPLGEGLRESAYELRWLLERSAVMLPIPGTSSVAHVEENMAVLPALS